MAIRRGRRGWPLAVVLTAAALVGVVALGIGYRVLAPAEVLTPARTAYPATPTAPGKPRVIGTLDAAPLIVDGRLRVFATTRQIRAEEPTTARTRRTPYWSFRRWPAQLSAVLAAKTTVLTRWSDGQLIALDAVTGQIAWRASGPRPEEGYTGRRTGAGTVYEPADLHSATTPDGRTVLLLTNGTTRGYDLVTGQLLWQEPDVGNCRTDAFTGRDGQLVFADRCAQPQAIEFRDPVNGKVTGRWRPPDTSGDLSLTPLGCTTGRSGCAALRIGPAGHGSGWLLPAETATPDVADDVPARPGRATPVRPVAAPALDAAGAVLVDQVAVVPDGAGLVARSARTGTELWRRDLPGSVVAIVGQPGRVHAITDGQRLFTLDPATGAERSRVHLRYGRDTHDWMPGHVYAAYGFVVVERLTPPVRPDADDDRYYATDRPVIVAVS